MKRIISIILILTMLLYLFGCKKSDTDDTAMPSTEVTKEDTPPLTAKIYVIEDDYIVAGVGEGKSSYGVRINMDTSKHDLAMYDTITFKDNLKPLKLTETYIYDTVYSEAIIAEYTAEYDDIVDFEFDPDNIDGIARVLLKCPGYLIVSYNNRPIIVKSANYNDFNEHEYITICGKASLLEVPVEYDYGRQTHIKYEVKNANVSKPDYIEGEDGAILAAKPVIYLYPEKATDVSVSVNVDGKLTCVYPEYDGVWQVSAEPDGTLTDKRGREYYCLYWEAEFDTPFDIPEDTGFVVKGSDTAEFLREKALYLGLSEKEANEFIIYWLPQMEKNEYNYIYFAMDEYETKAELKVFPEPDTTIRFMMLFKPLDKKIQVTEQVLEKAPARVGFTLVEWGGSKLR